VVSVISSLKSLVVVSNRRIITTGLYTEDTEQGLARDLYPRSAAYQKRQNHVLAAASGSLAFCYLINQTLKFGGFVGRLYKYR
jgi:hypothetical protein